MQLSLHVDQANALLQSSGCIPKIYIKQAQQKVVLLCSAIVESSSFQMGFKRQVMKDRWYISANCSVTLTLCYLMLRLTTYIHPTSITQAMKIGC